MKEYTVIYERGPNNWSAYSPDVPGCAATGKTREEVERNFRDARAASVMAPTTDVLYDFVGRTLLGMPLF